MANDAKLNIEISADADDAQNNVAQLASGIEQFGNVSIETTGKLESLKNGLTGVVNSGFNVFVDHAVTGLITLAAKTIAWGYALKHAISQEKGFADADRMFEGTAQEVEHLNQQLKELAVTKLAMPIEEVQHLAKVAGSMGKTADEVKDFIQTSSEAALSFSMPAEEMMTRLGGIQSSIGLVNEQLPTFTDQVKIAADTIGGMTTEAGIMEVLADGVGQTGRLMGFTAGETVAFSSTMLSLDGNTSKASNTLNSFLFSLKNINGQNAAFKATFEQLGIPIDQFAQDIKNKPVQAVLLLLEKIKDLKEGQTKAITGLVGNNVNQQTSLLGLVKNYDVLKTQLNATADSEIYAGGVHEAYEKKLDTADAKIQLMKNSLSLLSGALMSPFLPAVKMATDGITALSDWLRKSAENSPFLEIILKSISIFLSLGGAIHLAAFALPILGKALRLVTGGFGLLSAAAARVQVALGLSTLSVGGLTAALRTYITTNIAAVIATNNLSFSLAGAGNAIKMLGNGLKWLVGGTFGLIGIAVTSAVVSLVYFADKTSELGSTTAKNSEIARAAFSVLFDYLKSALKPVLDAFNQFNATVADLFGNVKGKAMGMGEAFDLLLQKFMPFYDALKKAYALLEKMGAIKKFKVDIETEIKRNREQGKTPANPDQAATDMGAEAVTQSEDAIREAKKQADLVAKIQKEQREQAITDLKQAEADKLRVIESSGKSQQQIDEAVFREKIRTSKAIAAELAKQLAEDGQALKDHANNTKALSQEELLAKKDSLKQTETAYKTHIDTLNALEKDHRDKVIALDKDIRDVKKQGAAGERDIARAGMTDAQVFSDKSKEIAEKKAQVAELMRKKDYAAAAETAKELQSLTKEQAIAAQAAAKEQLQAQQELQAAQWSGDGEKINSALNKLNEANQKAAIAPKESQADYKAATDLATQALEKQKAEEQAKALEARQQAEALRLTFKSVGDQIAALNETLSKGSELKIKVDTSEVDQAKAKIAELNNTTATPAQATANKPNISKQTDANGKVIGYGDSAFAAEKNLSSEQIKTPPIVLPAVVADAIAQLRQPNLPNMAGNQSAQNQTDSEKVLGVYRLELASPAGTVNASIKASDKDVFEAYNRYAKATNRTTRDGY